MTQIPQFPPLISPILPPTRYGHDTQTPALRHTHISRIHSHPYIPCPLGPCLPTPSRVRLATRQPHISVTLAHFDDTLLTTPKSPLHPCNASHMTRAGCSAQGHSRLCCLAEGSSKKFAFCHTSHRGDFLTFELPRLEPPRIWAGNIRCMPKAGPACPTLRGTN